MTPIAELPNGHPQFFPMLTPGVYDETHVGPDGITDAQRFVDADPTHWGRDPDTNQVGGSTDDSRDTNI